MGPEPLGIREVEMKTQTRWVVFLFLVSSVVAGCGPGARAPAPASTASAISWGGQTYHEIPGTVSGCTMTFCVEGVPCHACLGDLSGCTPFSGCTDPANTIMGAGELCSTDGCTPSGCFPAYCDLWTGDCVVCDDGDPATEEQCINDPLSPCHFVPKGGPDEAVPDVPVPQDLPVIPEVVVPFDLPGLDVAGLRDLIVLPDLPVPVDYVPGEDVPGEDVQEVLDVAGREDTPAVFDVPPLEDVPGVPDTPVIPDVPAGEDLPGTVDVPGAEDVPLPSDPGMPTDTSVSDVTPPADVFIPGDAGGDACVPPDSGL